MTTIRTTCHHCGDVELSTGDLRLELGATSGTGTYRFDCPFCGGVQRRPANARVVSILLATGVAYEVRKVDGPITEAEIEMFVEALESDGWYSELPI